VLEGLQKGVFGSETDRKTQKELDNMAIRLGREGNTDDQIKHIIETLAKQGYKTSEQIDALRLRAMDRKRDVLKEKDLEVKVDPVDRIDEAVNKHGK